MRTRHADNEAHSGRAAEQHYLVAELSALWGYSAKTIRRLFEGELGVIAVGHEETLHKRGYLTISIPASVADFVHAKLELRQNGLRKRIR